MLLRETEIHGVFLVDPEPHQDERGFFARTFCVREFAAVGVSVQIVQSSISWNPRRGTIRGMHFQLPPSQEAKLIRCVGGHILDVLIDLRPSSPSYTSHIVIELNAETRRALFVPPGVAHGFQTLADNTEVFYQMSDFYDAELSSGVRWSDPAFGIRWPIADAIVHSRDDSYPDFDAAEFAARVAAHVGAERST